MGGFWDFLVGVGAAVEQFVLDLVESLGLYPSLFAMSGVDGLFPVFPSESALMWMPQAPPLSRRQGACHAGVGPAIAVNVWAALNIIVGGVVGELFGGNLLLAITVAVTFGVTIGYVAQEVLERSDIAPPELPDITAPDDEAGNSDGDTGR